MNATHWIVLLLVSFQLVSAREWVNDEGRKIEADYVSCDGTTVILMRAGKEIKYPLAKLSAADQDFIKTQQQADEAKSQPVAGKWIQDFAIKPAFPDADSYLKHRNAKAVYKAFDEGEFPPDWTVNKKDAAAEFAYDTAKASTYVYLPASRDGGKPPGVYIHISAGEEGEVHTDYEPVMDRLNLIYISPRGTSNGQPMLRRVRLAVDALSSVRALHQVDPARISIGGGSGGGHMAMLVHAMFPDIFMGSVSHAAQSYLPAPNSCGHFPGLEACDLKSGILKDHKWCVISGSKDFNYEEILKTSKQWSINRMNYQFIDVPEMGHSNAPPEYLEEALKWLGL
jgi:predicted esterase